jgi:hypothetical protein
MVMHHPITGVKCDVVLCSSNTPDITNGWRKVPSEILDTQIKVNQRVNDILEKEPITQFPRNSTKNAEWGFYWDGSVAEKEKKARNFFAAARLTIIKEFQHASPSCLVLTYEDLAQDHYHVEVFFEQYPSSTLEEKPDYFVECVVKYGGAQPDRANPIIHTTSTTAAKWLQHAQQAAVGVPPGCGGYRIADTFVSRKEPAP